VPIKILTPPLRLTLFLSGIFSFDFCACHLVRSPFPRDDSSSSRGACPFSFQSSSIEDPVFSAPPTPCISLLNLFHPIDTLPRLLFVIRSILTANIALSRDGTECTAFSDRVPRVFPHFPSMIFPRTFVNIDVGRWNCIRAWPFLPDHVKPCVPFPLSGFPVLHVPCCCYHRYGWFDLQFRSTPFAFFLVPVG